MGQSRVRAVCHHKAGDSVAVRTAVRYCQVQSGVATAVRADVAVCQVALGKSGGDVSDTAVIGGCDLGASRAACIPCLPQSRPVLPSTWLSGCEESFVSRFTASSETKVRIDRDALAGLVRCKESNSHDTSAYCQALRIATVVLNLLWVRSIFTLKTMIFPSRELPSIFSDRDWT